MYHGQKHPTGGSRLIQRDIFLRIPGYFEVQKKPHSYLCNANLHA